MMFILRFVAKQRFSLTPGTKKSVVGGSDIGWLRDGLDGGVLLAPVSDMGEPGSDFDQ